METKVCPHCEIEKPTSEYYKRKTTKDGLRSWCKECEIEVANKYNAEHREERNEYQRNRYKENPEKCIEAIRKYRETCPDYSTKKKRWRRNSYLNNMDNEKQGMKEYLKTENGRESLLKSYAKRQRNLDWILLFFSPFPEEVKVDYHHINDWIVVPLPSKLHENLVGQKHRERCDELIKHIYITDFTKIIEECL